jgi:hypothetical protein
LHQTKITMKRFLLLTLLVQFSMNAQKPCEFSANVTDSIGTYKATKDYLVFERNFAGTAAYAFFSLVQTDGMPTLNVQLITKSKDFIKANCIDKNTKMYVQLDNGKIITLLHMDTENCGSVIRDDKGNSNRVLSADFMFMKNTIEELKKSPISLLRIKYATETVDYIIKSELKSEMDGKTYEPGTYFMNTLHCVTD